MKYLLLIIPFYLIIACGTGSNEAADSAISEEDHVCTEQCTEGTHTCGEHCGCGDDCKCTAEDSCSEKCEIEKS